MSGLIGYIEKNAISLGDLTESFGGICDKNYTVLVDGKISNKASIATKDINSDEELLLALIYENDQQDKIEMIKNICNKINGNPTFAFVCNEENAIYAKKGNEPLVVGFGADGFYICSQLVPLFDVCKKYIEISDGFFVKITATKIFLYDENGKKTKLQPKNITKCKYPCVTYSCFEELMLSPKLIGLACKKFVDEGKLNFDFLKLSRRTLDRFYRIVITANNQEFYVANSICGNIELLADVETIAVPSTILQGSVGYLDKETLVIAISHFGEDMPTVCAAKRAKHYGAKVLCVTSNSASYLARISDYVIDCDSDFIAENHSNAMFGLYYFVLALLGVYLGEKIGYMSGIHTSLALKMAEMLQGKMALALKSKNFDLCFENDCFVVSGFNTDFGLAKDIAAGLRGVCKKSAFAVPLEEIEDYLCKEKNVFVVISTSADFDVVVPILEKLCKTCNPVVFTTDNIAGDLDFCKDIVVVGDTLPLFNQITISTLAHKTILAMDEKTKNQQVV